MTNEMKALSKLHAREGLWMTHAPVPEIGPDDVLIKINKTGICGTDSYLELGRLGGKRPCPCR